MFLKAAVITSNTVIVTICHMYTLSTVVSVQMYVVEISPAVGKGLFGALNQLAITFGILAIEAFGIGNVLKYYHLAILPMMVILLFTLTVLGIFFYVKLHVGCCPRSN